MKNTLGICKTGYGHWRITTDYYGRIISCITTNSQAIDDFSMREQNPTQGNRGFKELRSEIIRKYKGLW